MAKKKKVGWAKISAQLKPSPPSSSSFEAMPPFDASDTGAFAVVP